MAEAIHDRLEHAGILLNQINNLKESKNGIGKEIKEIEFHIHQLASGDLKEDDPFKKIKKLFLQKSKKEQEKYIINKKIKKCNDDLESVILGKGDHDESQLHFPDPENLDIENDFKKSENQEGRNLA